MTIDINNITVKLKKEHIVIKEGIVVQELICKIPLKLLSEITFEPTLKLIITSILLEEGEIETIMAMKLADDAKNKSNKK